jgi:hypothetical protein
MCATYTRILDKAPQKGNNWVVLLFGSEPLVPGAHPILVSFQALQETPGTIAGNLLRLLMSLSGLKSNE